ncbi:chaperone protein ClpB3, mitochondrial-like isoform X1 [Salvia miltiorrhiza]|uniref:chaperone protein ClpB3, mitochondrial-like isoform X1 n=1 Tax=Salvia miltiorrhiza TaxID=226208 RepID=UPI0025AD1DEF|nr:chaperone protein ClpB3, mitochondrial-like isoform X1 [Salvia miltiorrhiza]
MGDSFLSVEHLVLAFPSDKRFGQKLLNNLQLSDKALKDAVDAVRGSQRVTDQNPEGKYEALEKYGNDLTELARRGKLDPVIGRDDEIRRCIQILSRRTKNNPVIIGEPGVGKTAIAEGLAQRIVRGDVPEPLLNRKVFKMKSANVGEFGLRIVFLCILWHVREAKPRLPQQRNGKPEKCPRGIEASEEAPEESKRARKRQRNRSE